jgi:N-acetyl-anhydromuramoyl-L-alanine amidase
MTLGSAKPVYGARVRLIGYRRGTTTNESGNFSLAAPTLKLNQSATIYLLMSEMWPRRIRFTVSSSTAELSNEQCTLEPIGGFWTKHIVGEIAAFFGPKLLTFWYGSTLRERILYTILFILILTPLFLFGIDRGLPIPWTDFDEVMREAFQRTTWLPSSHVPVRFSKIRRTYHAGVQYMIGTRDYSVTGIVEVEKGASVAIEAGTHFAMGANAGFEIRGLLKAEGGADDKLISFDRAKPDVPWLNLTFWGQGTEKSILKGCRISGGTGRACSNATEGDLYLNQSGAPKGGALLLYDTFINVDSTQILNCSANVGGGIYQRNAFASTAALPGSTYYGLTIHDCVANAGGGAVFSQRCYPEFSNCLFEKNKAQGGAAPCGGAIYMGLGSRAKFTNCNFLDNSADAEGGAIYAFNCYTGGNDQQCGVCINGGLFKGNHAHGKGGALSALNSRVALVSPRFEDNYVEELTFYTKETRAIGGAVYLEYTATSANEKIPNRLASCEFTGNRCVASAEISPDDRPNFSGGAVHIRQSAWMELTTDHLRFNNNHAPIGQHVALPANLRDLGWSGHWDDGTEFRSPSQEQIPQSVYEFNEPSHAYSGPIKAPVYDERHLLPTGVYDERPPNIIINAAVIHFISAATIAPDNPYSLESILRILSGEVEAPNAKVSAHYLIDRAGQILRLVPEKYRAWHAGQSKMPNTGEENINDFSIGIEMIRTAEEPPTSEQYEALVAVLCDIRRRHPGLSIERIVGHDTVRSLWHKAHPQEPFVSKNDPGPLFHWSYLMRELNRARFE